MYFAKHHTKVSHILVEDTRIATGLLWALFTINVVWLVATFVDNAVYASKKLRNQKMKARIAIKLVADGAAEPSGLFDQPLPDCDLNEARQRAGFSTFGH
jgi:hypothetical protein